MYKTSLHFWFTAVIRYIHFSNPIMNFGFFFIQNTLLMQPKNDKPYINFVSGIPTRRFESHSTSLNSSRNNRSRQKRCRVVSRQSHIDYSF